MGLILLVLLFMVFISGIPAYFISGRVRKQLESTGSPYSRSASVILFILIAGLIFIILFLVAVNNIRIER